jgi:hypothetical protein
MRDGDEQLRAVRPLWERGDGRLFVAYRPLHRQYLLHSKPTRDDLREHGLWLDDR